MGEKGKGRKQKVRLRGNCQDVGEEVKNVFLRNYHTGFPGGDFSLVCVRHGKLVEITAFRRRRQRNGNHKINELNELVS